MLAETEILVHPYDTAKGKGVLFELVHELTNGDWAEFRGAIHFAKRSGNYDDLLTAMEAFLKGGGRIDLTFGADVFGPDGQASDLEAIDTLLQRFDATEQFRLFLYHERGRTFHPKLYLFSDEPKNRALLLIGSSNWSEGGFATNIEANVRVKFDLAKADHRASYDNLLACFVEYWTEAA